MLSGPIVPASCVEPIGQTAGACCIQYAHAHGGNQNGEGLENKFFDITVLAGSHDQRCAEERVWWESGERFWSSCGVMGSRGTIAEMVNRGYVREEFEGLECTKEGRGEVLGEGRLEGHLAFCGEVVDGRGEM